jgi:hypothetical protein
MSFAALIAGTFLPMASEAVRMGRVRAMERARKRELERQAARQTVEVVSFKTALQQKPRSLAERQISKRLTGAVREAEAARTKQAFKVREARETVEIAAKKLIRAINERADVMAIGSEHLFARCLAGVTGCAPVMDETGRVLGPMQRCADCGRLRYSYARRTRVFYAWVWGEARDFVVAVVKHPDEAKRSAAAIRARALFWERMVIMRALDKAEITSEAQPAPADKRCRFAPPMAAE